MSKEKLADKSDKLMILQEMIYNKFRKVKPSLTDDELKELVNNFLTEYKSTGNQSDRWKGEFPPKIKNKTDLSEEVKKCIGDSYMESMKDFYKAFYPDTLYKLYYPDGKV